MKKIIFNKSGEVRHLWKFLFTMVLIVVSMILIESAGNSIKLDKRLFNPVHAGMLVGTLLSLKFVYKVSFGKLGFALNKKNVILLFVGAVIPLLVQFQMFIVDRFIFHHYISFIHPELSVTLAYSLFSFLIVAAAEETFFRVYLIGYFKDKFNIIYFFVLSAVLFSLLHATGLSSYNHIYFIVLLLSGIFYGLLYLISKSFYFVFAAHAIHDTFLIYPVNDSNTNVYLFNQLIVVTVILVICYLYNKKSNLLASA